MKPVDGLALFEKVVFGWLPKEPGAASGQPERPPMRRTSRLASFFVFELLVLFVAFSVFQLAGLGDYPGFVAGAVAPIAGGVGSALFFKPKKGALHAEVAGFQVPAQHLDHVIDHRLLGLVVEGTSLDADRNEMKDRLSALRKGDTVSYNLITDNGKAITGSASVRRVVTRAKSHGRLRFEIRMRRIRT